MMTIQNEINGVLAQIRALSRNMESPAAASVSPAAAQDPDAFGSLLRQAVETVNQQQQTAETLSTRFQAGDPNTSIADVVVEMQKASISFQAMTEARNRIVEAYREIMNMSV